MSVGRRRKPRQMSFCIATGGMPESLAHPFCWKLNEVLDVGYGRCQRRCEMCAQGHCRWRQGPSKLAKAQMNGSKTCHTKRSESTQPGRWVCW